MVKPLTYFAELDNFNIVKRVIVADRDFIATQSGNWKETSPDGSFGWNYAGVGYLWDGQQFAPPSPGTGWVLTGGKWYAPWETPPSCQINFNQSYRIVNPAVGVPTTRVFIFQGYPGDNSGWDAPPTTTLTTALTNSGYQVVLVAQPVAQTCFFSDGGLRYQIAFKQYLLSLLKWLPPITRQFIGGISYGGLHSLMGMEYYSDLFDGWFACLPVTRLDALTELSSVGTVTNFEPFSNSSILSLKNGLITWGTADTRVNYLLTIQLANNLAANITKIEYPGLGHVTGTQQINDILSWLNTN